MNLLLMGETLAHSFLCQSAKGHLIDYFLSTIQNDYKTTTNRLNLIAFPPLAMEHRKGLLPSEERQ